MSFQSFSIVQLETHLPPGLTLATSPLLVPHSLEPHVSHVLVDCYVHVRFVVD